MPQGVTCHQPISLIDVYPTFIDICGLPKNPHAGRSDYPLDGHSIKPLVLDPDGNWDGPEVAITALPGKDHSQHRQHIGTLYPHFSVRAKDWRYILTSNGQEELYRYSTDVYEFTNLADDPEFADVKAKLKQQLIVLRDGDRWTNFDSLPATKMAAFELQAEVRGDAAIRFGDYEIASVKSEHWVPLRIRLAGKRCQVWLDNRVFSDDIQKSELSPAALTSTSSQLANIRIREL